MDFSKDLSITNVFHCIHTVDVTVTVSRKFIYTDDVALVVEVRTFVALERTLNQNNLIKSKNTSYLTLNTSKSVARIFHLNNRETKRELDIKIDGVKIFSEECPKYLEVKFNRTLTYNQHLKGVKSKLKTRNNIMADYSVLARDVTITYSRVQHLFWCIASLNTVHLYEIEALIVGKLMFS